MLLVGRMAAAVSAGLGAWLALGAVAIAPGVTTPSRIGVLPPFWVLAVLIAVFLAIVLLLRWPAARVRPLFAAWVCALPWIPGAVPASLLAWQGVLGAGVWIGIGVAVASAAPLRWPTLVRPVLSRPALAPWLAGALTACVFFVAWRGTADWLPGGDEPHYLIITQSLLLDGDLQIENNHRRGDYTSYYLGELKPDFLRRGIDEQIYSIHAPGISAWVLPAFAIGGYPGAVVFLIICCALGTALAWRLAWEVTGDAAASWFGWATVSMSIPMVVQGYTVYPDGLAAALTLGGVWGAWRARSAAPAVLVLTGAALALLPWMHTRAAVIAGTCGLVLTVRLWPRPDRWRALAAFGVLPVASAVTWFGYFKVIYGTFDPSAPYGGYTQSAVANVPSGLAGVLFDQQYGLVANAPAFIAAAVGLVGMLLVRSPSGVRPEWGAPRRLAVELLVTAVPYALVAAAYRMWWAGASGPARFLVPVLLPMAIPAAWAWAHRRAPADRSVLLALLVLTAAQTAAMTWGGDGRLAITVRAWHGPFEEWATRAVDLSAALPSLLRDSLVLALEQTAVWLAALLAWWLALRVLHLSRAATAAIAIPLGVGAAMLAFEVSWAVAEVTPLRIDTSRHVAWLRSAPGWQGVAFQRIQVGERRQRRGLTPLEAVLPALAVRTTLRESPSPGRLAAIGPVPPGRYRVRVPTPVPPEGTIRAEVGRGGVIAEHDLASLPVDRDRQAFFDLELPLAVLSLAIETGGEHAVRAATVAPLERWRDVPGNWRVAPMARAYGGVRLFFPTDAQYPEPLGVWLKAGGEVPIIVSTDPDARAVGVFLRNGPLSNHVRLQWTASQELSLAPHEESLVELPWPAGARHALLRVRAAEAFRPVDVDPATHDPRRLGVWLQVDRR